MYDMPVWYLGEFSLPVHWVLMAVCYGAVMALALFIGKKKGFRAASVLTYGVLAAALGLLIGRAVYCAVRWYDIFLDEMGEFRGILPFFNPTIGSVNVMGIVAGVLLAALAAAAVTKEKASALLDLAAAPGLVMYALARIIEPLSGQGYGNFMELEVSVCWIEAALALVVLACVGGLSRRVRRSGTLAQYALVLLCLTQILPESLRCDDAIFVFIFARVTHLGLAVAVGLTLIRLLVQGAKQGLDKKSIVWELVGLAAGIGLCIATIFALDKTNLPKLLVYAVMILALAELGYVICRRIRREDLRGC